MGAKTALKNLVKSANETAKAIDVAKKRNLETELKEYATSQESEAGGLGAAKKLYRGLEKQFDPNYNLSSTDAPQDYSTWTDNPELARQYAGEQGYIYEVEVPESMMGRELIDADGERALFVNNKKKAGLNNISGEEFLLYEGHEAFSPDMIKPSQAGQATTKQMAGTAAVGAAGMGLQAFIEKRTARKAMDNLVGAGEVGLMMGSSYLDDILSGLAGIYQLATQDSETAAATINRGVIPSYTPKTEAGMRTALDVADDVSNIGRYWSEGIGAQGRDPIANAMQSGIEEYLPEQVGEFTRGMKPIDNFKASADKLGEISPAAGALLYGLPDVI